jgi:hypothetical protein
MLLVASSHLMSFTPILISPAGGLRAEWKEPEVKDTRRGDRTAGGKGTRCEPKGRVSEVSGISALSLPFTPLGFRHFTSRFRSFTSRSERTEGRGE